MENKNYETIKATLLTAAEEVTLAKKILTGDSEARNTLIERNLRLVYSEARRFKNRKCEYEDLVQEGSLGLIHAVDLFDYTKGFRFSTYAVWVIRSFMRNFVAGQSSLINVGRHTLYAFGKIKKELADKATDEEIYAKLKIKKRTLDNYKAYSKSSYMLFSDILDEEKRNFVENNLAAPGETNAIDGLINAEKEEMIKLSLKSLTPKEKYVIKHKYGLEGKKKLTLREMGKQSNLTKDKIKQIILTAEEKMTKNIQNNKRFDSNEYSS